MKFSDYYLNELFDTKSEVESRDYGDVQEYKFEVDEHIYTDPEDPSYGREDEIHTTILYGIHDENPDEVAELVKDVEPFEVQLGPISYFDSDDYNVMKVDVDSPQLHDLNQKIQDNVDFSTDYPEYKPHMTIAYVTKDFPKDEVDIETFKGLTQLVKEIIFSSKNGQKTSVKLGGMV